MPRQSRSLRLLIALVTAWYSLIAGGQLSLAESVLRSAHMGAGTAMHEPMSSTPMAMAGMDCHGTSHQDGQKHLCLCIDIGCFQIGVALPSGSLSHALNGQVSTHGAMTATTAVATVAPDYLLPPATAPPQA